VFIDSQLGCYVGGKEELDVDLDDDYIHYELKLMLMNM